jgi:hypothetical protein
VNTYESFLASGGLADIQARRYYFLSLVVEEEDEPNS